MLVNEISAYITVPQNVVDACRILNRYYIPTRYPNAFPSGAPIHMFDEKDAMEALEEGSEGGTEVLELMVTEAGGGKPIKLQRGSYYENDAIALNFGSEKMPTYQVPLLSNWILKVKGLYFQAISEDRMILC